MKPLYKVLGKSNIVNEVAAKDIKEAIIKVYQGDIYKFIQNSELIDVKDRFRIFKYHDKDYIVKTMSSKNSHKEYNNSLKCRQILNGIKINKYIIEVIIPKLFTIDNKYYVLTEYKGQTLQELLYQGKKNNLFKLTDLELLMKIFFNLGIEHTGLCPRNIAIKDNHIYLFDFEDVKIFHRSEPINLRYKTNILINWTYFYKKSDLENVLESLAKKITTKKEPYLNKYECNYKQLINFKGNNYELRKNIMETVLQAEEKISKQDTDFCLLPMDMAAIISDLFDFSTDAIMDMVFSCIRKNNNQEIYLAIIHKFSQTVIELYKKGEKMQPYILPILLFAIDVVNDNQIGANISDNIYGNSSLLLKTYFNNDKEKFKKILEQKLDIVFKKTYANYKRTMTNINDLSEHFISFNIDK